MLRKNSVVANWGIGAAIGAVFIVSATAIAAPPVMSSPGLTIDATPIGTYPGADRSVALGINGAGDVSGYAFVGGYAGSVSFLWNKATNSFATINLGSAGWTFAYKVNDAGVVVGDYLPDSSGSTWTGFVFDSTTNTAVSYPGVLLRGISNAGDLAGYSEDQPGGNQQAVRIWNGQAETFSCFGSPETFAESINTSGDVVGGYVSASGVYSAFFYQDGACIDISVPGANWTVAWGINDRGDIVGEYAANLGGTCVFGAFHRHGDQLEVTRIPCASSGWLGASSKFWTLGSINNDRVVVGTISGLRDTPAFGTIVSPKVPPN